MANANEAVLVYCNNMAALTYTKDPKYHGTTTRIDI